ncbi:acyloxyacyl hydrolase [uncultured Microbulbifer sp.]|uniref:acyloxyacyl hydrolase n=1 Tax=uncultured Microbulbifer sp. TaxID=348147 RepID=UPI002605133C|nr:acyloxyacyl hydrolase [uncultured Microbulbifer sp.]
MAVSAHCTGVINCILLATCGFSISPTVFAEQELIVSAGKGLGKALLQRNSISAAEMAGVNYSYLFASSGNASNLWQWWGQGSYSYLRLAHHNENQQQNIVEIKPVLRWYPRNEPSGTFAEAGVGASYLSRRNFGDIQLSTKLNFALHFALGYRFSSGHTLSLRYSHFSNAYTNNPNPGFDFASLNGHFNF